MQETDFHFAKLTIRPYAGAMAYDYEQLYRDTPDALGPPTQAFTDAFAQFAGQCLRILDIGCGQGRDALVLGRDGHCVVGVDLAPSGIRDLTAAAEAEGLAVTGVVADITRYMPDGLFDIVLIDRTLHMLDAADRLSVLDRLLDHVPPGGRCLIADEPRNIAGLTRVAMDKRAGWTVDMARKGYLFLRRAEG